MQTTEPCLLNNQQAIIQLAIPRSKPKSSWCYICQGTGTGKSSQMVDLGYLMGLSILSKKEDAKVIVRLVVMSKEFVKLY